MRPVNLGPAQPLYPFESHFLDRSGLRYHYLDEGRGGPVVMVHGNPTWSFYFRELVLALRGNYRCIVPDHIGCGLSDRPDDSRYEYTLERRVDDLEALLDHLGLDSGVTLLMHDWGGMIGMGAALRRPQRIARIIALNTAAFLKPPGKHMPWPLWIVHRRSRLSALLVQGFNAFSWGATFAATAKRLPRIVRRGLTAPYNSWSNRLAVLRFVQDAPLLPTDRSYALAEELDRRVGEFVDRPMLICWGERDWVFDHHFLAEWRRRFPDAEVHAFPDAGHYVLEDAADRIIPLVRDFLQRTKPAAANPQPALDVSSKDATCQGSPIPNLQSTIRNPQSAIPNLQSPIPNPQSPPSSPSRQDFGRTLLAPAWAQDRSQGQAQRHPWSPAPHEHPAPAGAVESPIAPGRPDSCDNLHRPVNVAAYLPAMAVRSPDRPALLWKTRRDVAGRAAYSQWTFRQLNDEADRIAHGLSRLGIRRGTKTILMVPPRPELFALVFALFKVGAVVVLIDPGMGRDRMAECLRGVTAEAFIGVPLAHAFRLLHRGVFAGVRTLVTVGRRWFWGGATLADLCAAAKPRMNAGARAGTEPYEMAATGPDDPAAIIFTTGSTGPPKGVCYTHGMFDGQVRALRDHFGIEPGEIDLPTFPLFALFDPAWGMTAVIPEMDPTRPADADPRKIIAAIRDWSVTNMFGSPALLNRVGRYGSANGVKLPSLRRVVSAGAPASPPVLERFSVMLDDGAEIHTPYGATEALPVASIGSREILAETQHETRRGGGACVGRPVGDVQVRVIAITDEPIVKWSDDLLLPVGQIGEIVVKGPTVSREYHGDSRATALAKIPDGGGFWHRMGDVGRFDDCGRLWFCGRKSHRVITEHGTLFTIPCEAVFNQHPAVFRSALVGVGRPPRQTPVICIELEKDQANLDQTRLRQELLTLARAGELTRRIETVLFHPAFPVDIRHNAKIFREKLAVWAAERCRVASAPRG